MALEVAEALGDNGAFKSLGYEPLHQIQLEIFELCLQRTKYLGRLAFLYVAMNNLENLCKVGDIAESGGNLATRFQIYMLLCNL